MLKILFISLGLCFPQIASAQALDLSKRPEGPKMVVKSYTVEVNQSFDATFTQFKSEVGHLVEIANLGAMVSASYSGFGTPAPLSDYLLRTLPALNPALVAEDMPVSLNIALLPNDEGAMLRIMMSVPDSQKVSILGGDIPKGGTVLMDDSYVDGCQGQAVFSQASSIKATTKAYSKALENLGFTLTTPPHMERSFFVGHRDDCALVLYVQPDFETPDHSLVVVRFTED